MTASVGRRRVRRRPWGPALGLAVLLAALATACTGDGVDELEPPEPPPVEETAGPPTGRDVAVVLPDATALEAAVLDGLADRLDGLADDLPDRVGRLHVLRPDTPAFVADLLELAAARDAQLACVLGPGTEGLADVVARRHGRTTVCSLPAEASDDLADGAPPPPAVRVEVPVYELGLLVGTAARVAALARTPAGADDGEDDGEGVPAPVVGLVLGGDELDADRFTAGLVAGLAEVEAIEVADPAADPAAAVAAVLAAGAEVIVLDGADGAAEALAAVPAGVGVLVPVDLVASPDAEEPDAPVPVLRYRLAWELVIDDLVARVVDDRLDPLRVAPSSGVLELQPNPSVPGLEAALEDVLLDLVAPGDGQPPTAPSGGATGDGDG
jgi:hypothetical protein